MKTFAGILDLGMTFFLIYVAINRGWHDTLCVVGVIFITVFATLARELAKESD